MKIGVYGGTFNPPHLGHVTAARAVFELLKLDLLLLVPDREPPHKALPAGSPTPEQRLEMTRLAGEQLGLGDRVQVLDLELKRTGRSYTSDTLAQLKERYPEDELWLLMGTDMFLTIQTWHEAEKILSLAGIATFSGTICTGHIPRPGSSPSPSPAWWMCPPQTCEPCWRRERA